METRNSKIDLDALWQKSLVRVTDEFTLPPIILQVDDAIIGTLGNFSASTGKAKAKKTFNVSAIVASALINGQVLEYRASLPEGKRKILYFDTEQSPFHCKKVLQRILKLAGLPLDRQPENLIFSHLREIANPAVRCEIIRKAIYSIEEVGLVIIDGIRDLMLDINGALVIDYTRKVIRADLAKERRRKNTAAQRRNVRSIILKRLTQLDDAEILQDVRDNADQLTVTADQTDRYRVNAKIPCDWVRGMHVIAGTIDVY